MKQICMQVKRTYLCDVLVIGGGVAGISAAICAARNGAKVILAERDGCLEISYLVKTASLAVRSSARALAVRIW